MEHKYSTLFKVNFKTPSGLKIRLNHRYFFYQLTKTDKFCTDEEIVNNDTMYYATLCIENIFLTPVMLLQAFSLIAACLRVETPLFCGASVMLYIFGCLWRCSKQQNILASIFHYFSALYNSFRWVWYIALIILVFLFDTTYLIIPYFLLRITLYVYSLLQNHVILSITKKQHGVPFNDTEICAFRVFHMLSKSELKISDYIKSYITTICQAEYEVNQ